MTARQAAEALDAYLAEPAPALHRLRTALAGQGRNPDKMLDGSVYSVSPLWSWINARAGRLGLDPRPLTDDPSRACWPSWARHGRLVDPHPPAETIVLVDGFASYLGQVLLAATPQASWQVGEHTMADHPLLNYPVLASEHHQIFLPALPLYSVYQSAHGRDPMSGTEMLTHTRRTIVALHGDGPGSSSLEEPLVSVVAELDCFDVGFARRHPGRPPRTGGAPDR